MAEKQNDEREKEEQKQDQELEVQRQLPNALKFRKTTRRRTHRPARTDGTLPLIPMRGLVVYPGVLLSFDAVSYTHLKSKVLWHILTEKNQ